MATEEFDDQIIASMALAAEDPISAQEHLSRFLSKFEKELNSAPLSAPLKTKRKAGASKVAWVPWNKRLPEGHELSFDSIPYLMLIASYSLNHEVTKFLELAREDEIEFSKTNRISSDHFRGTLQDVDERTIELAGYTTDLVFFGERIDNKLKPRMEGATRLTRPKGQRHKRYGGVREYRVDFGQPELPLFFEASLNQFGIIRGRAFWSARTSDAHNLIFRSTTNSFFSRFLEEIEGLAHR